MSGIMPILAHPFIYELDQLSQALNKMMYKQNQRATYIKNFSSHVSHEFKTPITVIKGALELLSDHHQEMSAQNIKKFLNNINYDVHRMQQVMQSLTQLARVDMAISNNHKTQDLLTVLFALSNTYQKKLLITLETQADHYPIFMDKELIEMLFINLIENAVQHHSNKMSFQLYNDDQFLSVLVTDNGHGISENNAHKVFTPFFTTRRKKGGTGLGLVIIKSLMQAH